MGQLRDRSVLFIFFYSVLFLITLPFYIILFMFRHIVGVVVLIILAVFVPVHYGSDFAKIPDWYAHKYQDLKLSLVMKAVDGGYSSYVPQSILDEINKVKENMAKEIEERDRVKSENYNAKLDRVDEIEDMSVEIRQRRGFAKKTKELSDDEKGLVDVVLPKEAEVGVGGLNALMKKKEAAKEVKEEAKVQDIKTEVKEEVVSVPVIEEQSKTKKVQQKAEEEAQDLDDELDLF